MGEIYEEANTLLIRYAQLAASQQAIKGAYMMNEDKMELMDIANIEMGRIKVRLSEIAAFHRSQAEPRK